jgi:hypothetical protein
MALLLQSRETEYTTAEGSLLEQAAELRRSATFYRERAQQFERFIRSPHKPPPLVRQDEEVPRPKRDDPTWLNSWYGYYWRAMNKATSREWQAERLERQH